jgi:hypothetical protein
MYLSPNHQECSSNESMDQGADVAGSKGEHPKKGVGESGCRLDLLIQAPRKQLIITALICFLHHV